MSENMNGGRVDYAELLEDTDGVKAGTIVEILHFNTDAASFVGKTFDGREITVKIDESFPSQDMFITKRDVGSIKSGTVVASFDSNFADLFTIVDLAGNKEKVTDADVEIYKG